MSRRLTAGALALGLAAGGLPLLRVAQVRASSVLCPTPTVSAVGTPGTAATQTQHWAPQGQQISVTGSGFSCSLGTMSATIGGVGVPLAQSGNGSDTVLLLAPGSTQLLDGPVVVTENDNVGGGSAQSNATVVFVTQPTVAGRVASSPLVGQTLTATGSNLDLGGTAQRASATVRWSGSSGCPGATSVSPGSSSVSLPGLPQFCLGSASLTETAFADTSRSATATFQLPVMDLGSVDVAPHVVGGLPGSAVAGQTATVTGSGFGSGGSVTGPAATLRSWSDTAISVAVPDTATSGSISLVRSADSRTVVSGSLAVAARVDSVAPSSPTTGDTVTISGGGFGGGGSLQVSGTAVPTSAWSPTAISFTVPVGLHSGPVAIAPTGTSAPATAPSITFAARLDSVSPASANPGQLVQVVGAGFGTDHGTVTIGGKNAAVTVWGDDQVVVTVPSGVAPGTSTLTLTPASAAPVTIALRILAAPSATPGSPTPGQPASGSPLIPPSSSGPVVGHGSVPLPKKGPPPPVNITLSSAVAEADPGKDIPISAVLVAFGKPVAGAKVELSLVVVPGTDARVTPAEAVTDAEGRISGVLHLSRTPGDHILLAQSGTTSDEIRLVGRGAQPSAATGGGGLESTLVASPPRTLITAVLVLCLVLFLGGFAIQMLMPHSRRVAAVAGGAAAQTARGGPLTAWLRLSEGAAAVLQQALVLMVVVPRQLIATLLKR